MNKTFRMLLALAGALFATIAIIILCTSTPSEKAASGPEKGMVSAVPPVRIRHVESDPNVPKIRQVLLAHRRITVAEGRKFPTRFSTLQTPTGRNTAPYILISAKTINRDVHSQAMSNGAKVAGFLPHNALLVEADEETLKNLSEDPAFIAAVEYEPMDKIQPLLLAGTDATIHAKVLLMNACYLDTIRDSITSRGGQILKTAKNGKSLDATLPRKTIADLAAKGEVRWIEKLD